MNKNFFNDNMILDPIQKKLSNSLLDLQTKINNAKKSSRFTKEEDVWSIFYQMILGL